MPTSLRWRARLRAEYRWPYPALDPERWYHVRSSDMALEVGKYVWLDADPYPVEVYSEHLEPVRLDCDGSSGVSNAPTGSGRLARLRQHVASRYPEVPPGVWIDAAHAATNLALRPPRLRRPDGRRRNRLPDADFEFRDDEAHEAPAG